MSETEEAARALLKDADELYAAGQTKEAAAAYENVRTRFGSAAELQMRVFVAHALYYKGWCISSTPTEAMAVWDELIAAFGQAPEMVLRQHVASALLSKSECCYSSDPRLKILDELLQRYASDENAFLQSRVVDALLAKTKTLSGLYVGRYEEALAICEDVLTRFSSDKLSPESLAFVWLQKGKCLRQLKRYPEAFAAWQQLLNLFGAASEAPLRQTVLDSLLETGDCYYSLKQSEDEIATYDKLLPLFADAQEPALRTGVAKAMLNTGLALATLNRHEQAIAAFDRLLAWPPADPRSQAEDHRMTALLNKGRSLRALNRTAEAIAVYDDLLARTNAASNTSYSVGMCQVVACAYEDKAVTLASSGSKDDAVRAYKELYAFCRRNAPQATYGMEDLQYLMWWLGKTTTEASNQIKLLTDPPPSTEPSEAAAKHE